MPTIEQIIARIAASERIGMKLLIGGVLCFIPVAFIFAFGYLWRFAAGIRYDSELALPEWDRPKVLFLNGLRVFLLICVYGLAPLLVAFGCSLVFGVFLFFAPVQALAMLPIFAVCLLAPPYIVAALVAYQRRRRLQDALDIAEVSTMVVGGLHHWAIPALAYCGLNFLGWPLFGFAFFASSIALIGYLSVVFLLDERQATAS